MRCFLLLLLVAVLMVPGCQAWGLRRWVRGRVWRVVRRVLPYVPIVVRVLGKREIGNHDLDKDGFIDQSEAEKLFETRDAAEMLALADTNGDSKVSLAEWRSNLLNLRSLTERDVDDLQDSIEDDDE